MTTTRTDYEATGNLISRIVTLPDGKTRRTALKIPPSADEIRKFFPVMQYKKAKVRNIHQEWFSGVRGDVGGGYADDCFLSDIALNWMQCHAYEQGLGFVEKPKPMSDFDFKKLIAHDESNITDFRNRFYHRGETLHESIIARMAFDKSYHPCVKRVPECLFRALGCVV